MQRSRVGVLRLLLTPKLHAVNTLISAVLAAKSFVSEALVCELRLAVGLEARFDYLLALLGHLYCYTYEVQGTKVVFTLPELLGTESAALWASEVEAVFENPDYTLEWDLPAVQTRRQTQGLRPLAVLRLPNFQLRQYPPFNPQVPSNPIPKHGKVVLAGTFDYLHPGHLVLLTCLSLVTTGTAFLGLTREELQRNKKHKTFLLAYSLRQRELHFVMKFLAPQVAVTVFPLSDPVGPAATEPWDAIILSKEVGSAEAKINALRTQNGLKPLAAVVIDLVQIGTQKISSTDIRALLNERSEGCAEELQRSWQSLCSQLGLTNEQTEDWWSELCTNYSRNDRHYHTLEAVHSMLRTAADFGLPTSAELQVAIWFHRGVFHPDSSDNSERSAALCREFLQTTGLSTCLHAPDYILATGLGLPITRDGTELALLDLVHAVLGESREAYAQYAARIRKEGSYRSSFPKCRLSDLSSLLAREHIYFTEAFRSRLEETAAKNLQWEIEAITKVLPQL